MAPTTNAPKSGQQTRARPLSQVVLPVIPLPYVYQKQKLKAAAAAAAEAKAKSKREEEEALQTPVPPPVVEEISPPTPPPIDATPSVVNGSSDHASEKTDEISVPNSPEPVAEVTSVAGDEEVSVLNNTQEERQSTPSEAQSVGSRTTYQMPPPFVPANQTNHSTHPSSNYNVPNSANHESPRFPPPSFNGHMHHGHPSTGSLVFGNYPDSNTSSPAPLSAGHFAPPPFPPHGSHHPHHGPHQSNGGFMYNGTNGFSPMGPPPGYHPRPDGYMNPPADFSRRQMASFGPPEGYSPVHTPMGDPRVNAFDTHTPRSFQGSQSSAPAEVENISPAFGNFPVTNGTNGHVDEASRLPQPPRQKSQAPLQYSEAGNFPENPANQPSHPMDHLDGLVQYLQSQFCNPGMSDYVLELRYSDDRAPPVRIPGHGIIFARSSVLKELMAKQHQSDGYGRTLLVQSDMPFLRSDGFWMAVQRLYGYALLDPNVLAAQEHTSHSVSERGTQQAQFDFALGYASAGMILQIPPVVSKGIEFVTHLIRWDTVEKAVDFYLEGGLDSQWGNQNGQGQSMINHGPNANILIHNISHFLVKYFPAAFKLDTSVVETTQKPHLPIVPGHNPRLSGIKFGDHPSQEMLNSFSSNAVITTLSKILLKLPFHVLKHVLESPRLGNVSGWATAALRQEVMQDVIDEREKRRQKVHSSNVSNHDRMARSSEWDVVGWQETVQPASENEGIPILEKKWVGFTTSNQ